MWQHSGYLRVRVRLRVCQPSQIISPADECMRITMIIHKYPQGGQPDDIGIADCDAETVDLSHYPSQLHTLRD